MHYQAHCPCCAKLTDYDGRIPPDWAAGGYVQGKAACETCWQRRISNLAAKSLLSVGMDSDNYGRFATELHVGFLSITETAEQLARLRDLWQESQEPRYAVSKIETTELASIAPINRVARRVCNPE